MSALPRVAPLGLAAALAQAATTIETVRIGDAEAGVATIDPAWGSAVVRSADAAPAVIAFRPVP